MIIKMPLLGCVRKVRNLFKGEPCEAIIYDLKCDIVGK